MNDSMDDGGAFTVKNKKSTNSEQNTEKFKTFLAFNLNKFEVVFFLFPS